MVKVDEITFEVDELKARVALHAAVGDLVALDVGADVSIGRVKLEIKGVEAQALLKVRLNNVYAILARTLTTIDRNPKLLEAVLKPLGETVGAAGKTVEKTVPPLTDSLGKTVERTVPEVTDSLGKTVERAAPEVTGAVGKTVEKAVPHVTDSLGKTVERAAPEVTGAVGKTVERAAPEVTGAVGKTVERAAPEVTGAVGKTVQEASPAGDETSHVESEGAVAAKETAEEEETPTAPSRPGPTGGMPDKNEPSVTLLFDGTESSFREWRHVGGGAVRHDEGTLCLEAGKELGLVYFTRSGFDDFRLRVQYRLEEGALAGLAVRFCKPGESGKGEESASSESKNPAYVAIQTGFEVHLGSDRPAVEPGTINGVFIGKGAGAQVHPRRAQIRRSEWNELELEVRGDEYVVWLNGKETARLTNVDHARGRRAAEEPDAGFIGFLLRRGKVWIGRTEVQPIDARPTVDEAVRVSRSKEVREPRGAPESALRHH